MFAMAGNQTENESVLHEKEVGDGNVPLLMIPANRGRKRIFSLIFYLYVCTTFIYLKQVQPNTFENPRVWITQISRDLYFQYAYFQSRIKQNINHPLFETSFFICNLFTNKYGVNELGKRNVWCNYCLQHNKYRLL